MAILKHITSKNADYGEAQRYLMFQYDEAAMKPVLDESGRMIPREEFYLDGINCDPFTFDMECKELNAQYRKNQTFDEIKSHHYILSFDPKDVTENGLTGERAQQLGIEYTRKNFPGHQALVCTHTDGNNESGNIHVHIVINSLRKYDVERRDFMERSCDSRAGYKHHLTNNYLAYLKQDVMDLCHREGLHQVDLLSPAEKKITDREYRAQRRGQKKLDERNQKMLADGVAPRKTKFETQKNFSVMPLAKLPLPPAVWMNFRKYLWKDLIFHLKSVVDDSVISIRNVGNILQDEIWGHILRNHIFRPYLKKIPDIHLFYPIQFSLLINQLLKISKSFPLLYSLNLTYGL